MKPPTRPSQDLQASPTARQGERSGVRVLLAAVLIVVGAVLLLLALWVPWLEHASTGSRLLARVTFFIGGLACLVLHIRSWSLDPTYTLSRGEPLAGVSGPDTVTLESVQKLSDPYAIDLDRALSLAEQIVLPDRFRARIVENVAVRDAWTYRRVSVQLVPTAGLPRPVAADGRLLTVVTTRPKGALIDNFSIARSDGSPQTTLTHMDQVAVLCRAAEVLFADACRASGQQASARERRAVSEYLLHIIADGPFTASLQHGDLLERSHYSAAAATVSGQLLEAFLECLTEYYPVLASFPVSCAEDASAPALFYKYEFTDTLNGSTTHNPGSALLRAVKGLMRRLTFSNKTALKLSARNALQGESYHLRVSAPSGYVIVDSTILAVRADGTDVYISSSDDHMLERPHLQLGRTIYQPFAHLYTRGLAEQPFTDVFAIARFSEDLPGTIGRAIVSAFAVLFTLVTIGAEVVTTPRSGEAGVDVVAFILALPAALSLWVGFSAPSDRQFASMSARFSLLASTVLSLCAVILYLWPHSGLFGNADGSNPPGRLRIVFVESDKWSWLIVLAGANFVWMLCTLAIRSRRRARSVD